MLGARRRTLLQFLAPHAADGAAGAVGDRVFNDDIEITRIARKDGLVRGEGRAMAS